VNSSSPATGAIVIGGRLLPPGCVKTVFLFTGWRSHLVLLDLVMHPALARVLDFEGLILRPAPCSRKPRFEEGRENGTEGFDELSKLFDAIQRLDARLLRGC